MRKIYLLYLIILLGIFVLSSKKTECFAADDNLIWAQVVGVPSGYVAIIPADIAIDTSGIYIAGGQTKSGPTLSGISYGRIEKRRLTDGSLLWFHVFTTSYSSIVGVAVDTTGVYLVASEVGQWRIEKRNLTDGSLIWSQVSNPTGGNDFAYGIAVDATGVYVVGNDSAPGRFEWRIEKRNLSNGSLIWSQVHDFNDSSNRSNAYRVAVDATGVYVVGTVVTTSRIEKRNLTNGSLIWSQVSNSGFADIAVDNTGIYIAGGDSAVDVGEWGVEKRNLSNGSLIWSRVTNLVVNGLDYASSITVDNSGSYVAGSRQVAQGSSDALWRIEKRKLNDGSLVAYQESNPSNTWDAACAIVVDSSGVYIAGMENGFPGFPGGKWRIEKRRFNNYIDIGLRLYDGSQTIIVACEPDTSVTSSIRIAKDGKVYGIALVDITDSMASKVRIKTIAGIKAIRKF